MAIRQVFLSWEEALLPQAAAWLLRQTDQKPADLSRFLVVVPVRSARRRLLELLTEHAGGRVLTPEVMTPAELPERLYEVKQPFASGYTQQMSWRKALQETPAEQLARVVPKPPAPEAFREWLSLADLLAKQHRELAGDGLDFKDVAERGAELPRFPDRVRWETLAQIERRYLDTLDQLQLWDQQAARLFAVQFNECQTERDVVLIGTSDLNAIVREMLDQVTTKAEESGRGSVTALIHAPAKESDRFDSHGCLDVASWQTSAVPIAASQLLVTDGPDDETRAIGNAVASLAGQYAASDIAVACPDDRIVPLMSRVFREAGIETTWSVGRSLASSRPSRLLSSVVEAVDRPSTSAVMAIVRHPDVLALVEESLRPHVLGQLDEFCRTYHSRQLRASDVRAQACKHQSTEAESPERGEEDVLPREWAAAVAGLNVVESILDPITSSSKRTVAGWAKQVSDLWERVFGQMTFDVGRTADVEAVNTIERLRTITDELDRCPSALDQRVAAGDGLRLILSQLASATARTVAPKTDALALTGWLELPLDDRPVVIVTSFNEGMIPTSVTSDLFLPGTLRQHLGINDNARRYARDAYAATVLMHSREFVRIVVPRRDVEGNPRLPSRLLFTGTPSETVARFSQLLAPPTTRPPLETSWRPRHTHWAVPVPKVESALDRVFQRPVSVTSFRDYLACQYRFYLKHVLRLRVVDDVEEELSGGEFGSLLHRVLSLFGRDSIHHSDVSDEIEEFVLDTLQTYAAAAYGTQPLPAIQVQVEKARARLRQFAVVQARHRADGWSVAFAEDEDDETSGGAFLCDFADRDGHVAQLVGRIDRIDRHDDGRWLILDYKTGDAGKSPRAAHIIKPRGKDEPQRWVDLQLPLYRHLAEARRVRGRVETGYFNLPRSIPDTAIVSSEFQEDELIAADALARDILADIREGKFEQRADSVEFDDFAAICQADVLAVDTVSNAALAIGEGR